MMKARADGTPLEALIHIYWDKEDEKFILHVPRQSVGHAIVLPDAGEEPLDSDRYIHYADLHSHNGHGLPVFRRWMTGMNVPTGFTWSSATWRTISPS